MQSQCFTYTSKISELPRTNTELNVTCQMLGYLYAAYGQYLKPDHGCIVYYITECGSVDIGLYRWLVLKLNSGVFG